jgi:hypothetical protein
MISGSFPGFERQLNPLQPNAHSKPPVNYTLLPSIAPYHPNFPNTDFTFVGVHLYG